MKPCLTVMAQRNLHLAASGYQQLEQVFGAHLDLFRELWLIVEGLAMSNESNLELIVRT
jgi:hypothetical protein